MNIIGKKASVAVNFDIFTIDQKIQAISSFRLHVLSCKICIGMCKQLHYNAACTIVYLF